MELNVCLSLGTTASGLTLNAQIVNISGINVGSAIGTGFGEIGGGNYLWVGDVNRSQRGGIKFFEESVPSVILTAMTLDHADVVDANIVEINGDDIILDSSGVFDANIVQVSGEYISIEDFTSSIDIPTVTEIRIEIDNNSQKLTNISGILSNSTYGNAGLYGMLDAIDLSTAGLAGEAMRGTDNAALATNLMAVSGSVFDANIVQVSGEYVSIEDFGGSTTVVGTVDANVVSISGMLIGIDSSSIADSDEISTLGNLLIRNSRIIRLLP